jgi:peroxiredoxin
VITVVAMAAVGSCECAEAGARDQADLVGKVAPDFALPGLSGETVKLSDFKGKIVLLDFWATWCAPCRREVPGLNRLQRQFAARGFTVLGISLDEEGASVVRPIAQRLGMSYPVAIGTQQVATDYAGIQALPTAFLIGRDGRILAAFVGARDESQFAKIVRQAEEKDGVSSVVPQPNR